MGKIFKIDLKVKMSIDFWLLYTNNIYTQVALSYRFAHLSKDVVIEISIIEFKTLILLLLLFSFYRLIYFAHYNNSELDKSSIQLKYHHLFQE